MTLKSEAFVQAAETAPAVPAGSMAGSARQELLAALRPKVALLTELELDADAREAALTTLTDFCTGPVRRHLDAVDRTLYAPAAGAPETRLLIRALRIAATVLDQDIDALARTDDVHRARAMARSIEAHLSTHLAVEQTVLLPALAALSGGEALTLADDHETEALRHESDAAHAAASTREYLRTGPLQWQIRSTRVDGDV